MVALAGIRPGPGRAASLSWRPGLFTRGLLVVNVVFAAWLFSPVWWSQLGEDTRVFYAAGSLAAHHGDPYDPRQLFSEEDRLYNAGRATHDDRPRFAHATYANPPLFTCVLQAGQRLGPVGFHVVSGAVLLGAGLAGFLAILKAGRWPVRGLPLIFFLTSGPMLLALFVGNTSALLMGAWGAGYLLLTRGRALMAGALLSLLVLKPSVGIPAALVALFLAEGRSKRAVVGFGGGVAVLALIDVALTGVAPLGRWVATLAGYTAALSLEGPTTTFSSNSAGQSSLPGLFLDHLALPLAVAAAVFLAALIVAGGAGIHGLQKARADPELRLALGMALLLALCPYLHLNDVILDAMPVLVIASRPLRAGSRLCLVLFAALAPVQVVGVAVASIGFHYQPSAGTAGIGIALTVAALFATAQLARPVPPSAASFPVPA